MVRERNGDRNFSWIDSIIISIILAFHSSKFYISNIFIIDNNCCASIMGILHFKIELNRRIERFLSSSLLEQCERRLTGREKNNDLEEKKER